MKMPSFVFLAVFLVAACVASAAPPDNDICPVHKIAMQKTELRMVYGMPSPKEFEEMRAAKTRFPYGKDYVLGGCVVKPTKTVEGFLCAECVKARSKWLESHKPK